MKYNITRFVGIELEMAESGWGEESPPKSHYWSRKTDCSIHGNGVEFVFKRPLIGNAVVDAISNMSFWLKHHTKDSGKVYQAWNYRNSPYYFITEGVNNGFHLHIDYRSKTNLQGLNFCDVAHAMYGNILRTVDKSRWNNDYCSEYNYPPSEEACYGVQDISRYRWISPYNLNRYSDKRTVEVRLHEGTGDKDKILTWVEFWCTLANLCDNNRITPQFVRDYGFKGVFNRMRLSDKTKERFEQCI